jgi:hypothetical protein
LGAKASPDERPRFLVLAVYLALGGLWMIWGAGSRLNDIGAIATTLDGLLILVFAAHTLNFAMKREIARHRPWAMRLFIAASAVWYHADVLQRLVDERRTGGRHTTAWTAGLIYCVFRGDTCCR